jgi:hypothetical protein
MTEISKRFESLIISAQKKLAEKNQLLPIKTDRGILVGDVLIESLGHLKNLWKRDRLVYREVSLNDVAIRLANLLANNTNPLHCDQLYRADQEYGRWFVECQVMKQNYHNAVKSKDFDRSDVFLARYEESKIKAESAKKTALGLIGL